MWHASNLAFDLCPMLTQGAIEAIELRGSQALKEKFLPKMVAGTWTGTMNLTEPQAGSDLAAVRTRAVPQGDGTYKLFGQKIFITYGEHDYTENIIHLVLGAHAGRAGGREGHLAVRRAQVPGQRRRLARRAQRRALRVARAQARHPREPDGGDGLRRQGRRDRLPRRRGEPRPRVHVHHDEPRALLGRHGGRGHLRARVPARGRLRARSRAGQGRRARERRRGRRDHRAPRHPPHADDDARVHRGDARRRVRHRGGARQRREQSGRRRRARSTRRSSTS